MNVLTIAGNIGKDPRLGSVNGKNGPTSVLNFAVAVRKQQKGQDGKPLTLWVDCALWGNRAEALSQYLAKGSKVTVTGEADVSTYQANDGTTMPKLTLRVAEITLMGDSGQQQGQQTQRQPQQQPRQQPAQSYQQHPVDDFDDQIPF
jgi:single-strand DNA-binding protein